MCPSGETGPASSPTTAQSNRVSSPQPAPIKSILKESKQHSRSGSLTASDLSESDSGLPPAPTLSRKRSSSLSHVESSSSSSSESRVASSQKALVHEPQSVAIIESERVKKIEPPAAPLVAQKETPPQNPPSQQQQLMSRTRSLGRSKSVKEKAVSAMTAPTDPLKYPIFSMGVPPPYPAVKRNSLIAGAQSYSSVNGVSSPNGAGVAPMYDPFSAAQGTASSSASSVASASSGEKEKVERERRERVVQVQSFPSFAARKLDLEFHHVFPTVVDSDHLVDDIPCMIRSKNEKNKEEAVRGTLWVSGKHVGFSSSQNTPVFLLLYSDVLHFNKKTVALVIPSAIEIECVAGQKYFLSSFVDRDATLDLLLRLQNLSSNVQKQCSCQNHGTCGSCSSVAADRPGGTKQQPHQPPPNSTSACNAGPSSTTTLSATAHQTAADSKQAVSTVVPEVAPPSVLGLQQQKEDQAGKPQLPTPPMSPLLSRPSGSLSSPESLHYPVKRKVRKDDDKTRREEREIEKRKERERERLRKTDDLLSPRAGAGKVRSLDDKPPVTCGCEYPGMQLIEDKIYPVSFDIYKDICYSRRKDVFGGAFLIRFLHQKRKVKNMFISNWEAPGTEASLKPALDLVDTEEVLDLDRVGVGWHRKIEYTLPLSIPLGPPQTKCIIVEEIVKVGDGMICICSKTKNPDIFDGFQVVARICITRHWNGHSRQVVYANVEFWKFTLIKMPIANGAYGGVRSNCATLASAIEEYLANHPSESASASALSLTGPAEVAYPVPDKRHPSGSPIRRRRSEVASLSTTTMPVGPAAEYGEPQSSPSALMDSMNLLMACLFVVILIVNTLMLWRLLWAVESLGRAVVRLGDQVKALQNQ